MPAENTTNLANFIRKLLAQRGMTQKEFADQLNVSTKSVSRWVRGVSVPSISSISAISRVLGIPEEEFGRLQMLDKTHRIGQPIHVLLQPFMVHILEERRRILGLTIDDLSRRSGISNGILSDVLRGVSRSVHREKLKKIANAMDFSLDEILRNPKGSGHLIPNLPTQTRSAHFTIRDGLVTTVPTQEIGPDENDYRRLAALQTPLLQASKKSQAELSQKNKPFAALLDVTEKYLDELNTNVREINYAVLYAYGLQLAAAYESAEELIEKGELPDFSLDALTSTKSVLRLHGPFILSSKDGRDLVIDAERYERKPQEERQYQADVQQFGKILRVRSDLVEEKTAEFFSDITAPDSGSGQLERRYLFTKGAAKNLVIVFSAGALVASTAFIPGVGPVVVASLGLLTLEAMKKSKPFNDLSAPIRRGLDDLSDINVERLKQIPQEQREKMRQFVIDNKEILRRVGGHAREMQWFREVLDWITSNEKDLLGDITLPPNSNHHQNTLTKHVIFSTLDPNIARKFARKNNLSFLSIPDPSLNNTSANSVLDALKRIRPTVIHHTYDPTYESRLDELAISVELGDETGQVIVGGRLCIYDPYANDNFNEVVRWELLSTNVLVPKLG